MLEITLRTIEKFIPKKIFVFFLPTYHYLLALLGAIIYRFPSKDLVVIGVTGTKGKTTTSELVASILNDSGSKAALISTIQFKTGSESRRNLFKMTTPGRFFLQKFLREAVNKDCTHAVIEISSEAVLQFRHRFLYLDALIVTNISPEHIERHGSYENYRDAKIEIAKRIVNSEKSRKIIVLNAEDKETPLFAKLQINEKYYFSLKSLSPIEVKEGLTTFTYNNSTASTNLIGDFNLENIAAALTMTNALGVNTVAALKAVTNFKEVLGRVQKIEVGPANEGRGKQNFTAVVDYAHTADSMEKLYKAFAGHRKICVFGATGGGRDKWKRPLMGKVASQYCDTIILTDDDSYDEDTRSIIEDIEKGITNQKKEIILDRREAIRAGLKHATANSVVLITGKGTDPYLMGPNNEKVPWSDAEITREELGKILNP